MNKKKIFKKITYKSYNSHFKLFSDGQPIYTPGGNQFILPLNLTRKIINEITGLEGKIIPDKMPFYSYSVASIDKVEPNRFSVTNEIVGYIFTDTICYRSINDEILRNKQENFWCPVIKRFEEMFKISIIISDVILPLKQSKNIQKKMHSFINNLNNYEITAFYKLVTSSGSLILSVLLFKKIIKLSRFINLAILEELHQESKWGVVSDKTKRREIVCYELKDALNFLNFFY